MDRRELLKTMGVGSVGLSALAAMEARADEKGSAKLNGVHQECLEACSDCAKTCDMTYHHCLMMVAEGKKEHAKPLQMVADCSGFCALSACNIAKHSPLMAHSCEACAEACKDTLAVVAKFDGPEMKLAAKALERCERSCRVMLAEMGHHHH